MRNLIRKRYLLRQNLVSVIGFCLCAYFTYHVMMGDRSYMRLVSLRHQIETAETEYAGLNAQRAGLEQDVIRLRPGSLDKDFLEERARLMLGYRFQDEKVIFSR